MIRPWLEDNRGRRGIGNLTFAIILLSPLFRCTAETFTQTVVTSPAPPVPGLITVATHDGGNTQAVRILFVSDGELLSIPLSKDSETDTFRGLFPTPLGVGSYQLQLVRKSGGVSLSKRYLLPPICQEQRTQLSPSAGKIYDIEQEIVRTRFLISTLKRLEAE